MAQTCLQLVQAIARRVGISTAPNAAVTSADPQIVQLVELLNEEGQELASRFQWQALVQEATFTTVAAELQTAVATVAPGYRYIINNTIWNRDLRRPVYGPDSVQDWQQQKAIQIAGPFNRYRVRNGNIYFYPVPAAGQQCAFEYVSSNWVALTAGGGADAFAADTDTALLSDRLLKLGTVWRWKAAKGLTYAEDFSKYELAVADEINRDGPKPTLNVTGAMYDVVPLVVVPSGSWGGGA